MNNPRIILFDLDGTLTDNTTIVVNAYYEGMKKLGYTPKPREFIASLGGVNTFETGRALGVKEEDLQFIDAFFWEYFGKYLQELQHPHVFPCVKEFMAEAKKKNILVGVVTSNRKENARIILEKAGLLEYMAVIVGSDDPVKSKPSREPIDYALGQLGEQTHQYEKEEIWFVGDSKSDLLAAKAAGVMAISIPSKPHEQEIQALNPDMMYSSFKEFYESLFQKCINSK